MDQELGKLVEDMDNMIEAESEREISQIGTVNLFDQRIFHAFLTLQILA